jgi:multiple sugar transport system permease protein
MTAHPGDDRRWAWAAAAPALLCLALFMALPFALSVVLSLTDARLASPLEIDFVGMEQYRRVFADAAFRRAIANNLLFAAAAVPLQTALALAMALLVNQRLRAVVVFRTLLFLPVVFPLSLVSVVWVMIYAPGPNGTMNAVLEVLTIGAWHPRDFLHDPLLALPALVLTSVWQGAGFQMVVLLAGLQGIPEAVYEAARVDGAGRWQRFRHVTLPHLRNPLTFVVVVTTILSFRVFDQVRIMTRGGPENASTTVIHEAVRAAFDRADVARGAAMTVIFFALVLGLTILQRRLLKHREAA